jgi:hypothetical protein
MPNYKYSTGFNKNDSTEFDKVYPPGTPAPNSGIYRCEACGFEADSTRGNPLPPARSCALHSPLWKCGHGVVQWRLVAAAVHQRN